MGADTELALMLMVLGLVVFPLLCWLFCVWVDYEKDEVARRCRRKNREYFEWEQRQKRKKRRRKRK